MCFYSLDGTEQMSVSLHIRSLRGRPPPRRAAACRSGDAEASSAPFKMEFMISVRLKAVRNTYFSGRRCGAGREPRREGEIAAAKKYYESSNYFLVLALFRCRRAGAAAAAYAGSRTVATHVIPICFQFTEY